MKIKLSLFILFVIAFIFPKIIIGKTNQFVPPTISENLTRGPYLEKLTSTSIIIKWKTSISVQSKVMYGTDSLALNNNVTDNTNVITHLITLTNLQPATKYYYNIGSPTTTLQGNGQNYFITAPLPGTEGKYNFWLVGDCGNASLNQQQVRDSYISYMGNNPTNAWLLLGDNAYTSGTDAEYQTEFFDIYQNTIMKHAPLYPVPGNHDYNGGAAFNHSVPYYSIFDNPTNGEAGGVASGTEAYYSYDYGNVHFLSLDSYGKEDNINRLFDTLGPEVTWIKQDLAANTNKQFIIAYWHHPPYTMGSHNSDTETELVKIRSNFIRILERNGVDLIVCGHSHAYERSKLMKGNYGLETTFNSAVHNFSQSNGKYDGTSNSCTYVKDSVNGFNGTLYIVAGTGGQMNYGTQAGFPHNAMNAYNNVTEGGSVALTVEANRMDVKWICNDGVVRDHFTLIKNSNKRVYKTINSGQSVNLKASWPGQYYWAFNGSTNQTVTVSPTVTTKYSVQDQYQCVVDSFTVYVLTNSVTLNMAVSAVCQGSSITVPYAVSGSFQTGNVFTAQLSNAAGSFSNPVNIGTLSSTTSGTINTNIPYTTPAGNGYRIRIISSNPGYASSDNGFNITVNPLPVVGITATPSLTVCAGTLVTLSGTGATNYSWTGGISNGISFIPSSTTTYTVSGTNSCGSNISTITITVNPIPAPVITSGGLTILCSASGLTLSSSSGGSYLWSTGATTQNITITNSGTYSVTVTTNGCTGSSSPLTIGISASIPITPVSMTGPTNACAYVGLTTNATYSTPVVTGVNTYNWTVPANSTLVSGQGTNTIQVNYSAAFVSGNISVTESNYCGTSAAFTKTITKVIPAMPTTLTGPTAICSYVGTTTQAVYTTTAVTGTNITYTWTVPSGATIVSGQGATTISVIYGTGAVSGNVTVKAVSNCGNSAVKSLAVTRTIPAMPGTITGATNICKYVNTGIQVQYSIAAVSGAASYLWTIPAGTTIVSGQGTTILKVTFSNSFSSGSISVKALANCGNSNARTLTITKIANPPTTLIGNTVVCDIIPTDTLTYSTTAVTNALSYLWTVPAGITIVSGQGTTTIRVVIQTTFITGNISVIAVWACGNSTAMSKTIQRIPVVPAVITGNTNICLNQTSTYKVTSVSGATSYVWKMSAGITPQAGTQGTITYNAITFVTTVTGGLDSIIVNVDTAIARTATAFIKVAAMNTCGTTAYFQKNLTACRSLFFSDIEDESIATEDDLIKLFPNPTTGILQIINSKLEISTIEVYDALGNKIFESTINNQESRINIAQFNKGMYFVRVMDKEGKSVYSQRIIKE